MTQGLATVTSALLEGQVLQCNCPDAEHQKRETYLRIKAARRCRNWEAISRVESKVTFGGDVWWCWLIRESSSNSVQVSVGRRWVESEWGSSHVTGLEDVFRGQVLVRVTFMKCVGSSSSSTSPPRGCCLPLDAGTGQVVILQRHPKFDRRIRRTPRYMRGQRRVSGAGQTTAGVGGGAIYEPSGGFVGRNYLRLGFFFLGAGWGASRPGKYGSGMGLGRWEGECWVRRRRVRMVRMVRMVRTVRTVRTPRMEKDLRRRWKLIVGRQRTRAAERETTGRQADRGQRGRKQADRPREGREAAAAGIVSAPQHRSTATRQHCSTAYQT